MSTQQTSHRKNRYPSLDRTDAPDVPLWMSRLATDLDDAPKDGQGTLAARPGAGDYSGHYYFCTDTMVLTRWDGSSWRVVGATTGDLKHGLQAADHDGWIFADGRNNIARSAVGLPFVNLMLVLGYPGADGTKIGVPDYRGRTLVGLGTHADINALTDNDGLAVASRTPKHGHAASGLTAAVTDPGHVHGHGADVAAAHPGGSLAPTTGQPGYDAAVRNTDSATTGISVAITGQVGSNMLGAPGYGVGAIFVHI